MRISQTGQFKRDLKKQIRRGKDPAKITEFLKYLIDGKAIPESFKDHPLLGAWKDRRDSHIEPDWILIDRLTEDEIRLERTGSHSDLF